MLGLLAVIGVVALAAGCGDGEPADDYAAGEVRSFNAQCRHAWPLCSSPTGMLPWSRETWGSPQRN